MGYFMTLDDYDLEKLEEEIARRKKQWELGLCDYCDRPIRNPDKTLTSTCLMEKRHVEHPKEVDTSCPGCGHHHRDCHCPDPCEVSPRDSDDLNL